MYYLYFLIKFIIVSGVFWSLPLWQAILFLTLLYNFYHSVLMPKVFGLHPLTLEDSFMLYENERNRANFGGVAFYDKVDFETLNQLRTRLIKRFPRLRQKLVCVFGSYYFKDISLEEAGKAIVRVEGIHTKEQLEEFCEKICQSPIPKEQPLYKVWIMDDYSETETAGVLLCHHSIFDGLSNLYLTWMYSKAPGDVSMLPNIREFTLVEKIVMHLTMIASLPFSVWNNLMKKKDKNPINNGKPLTGIKKFTYFDDVPFEKIKENYKKCGVTLNDYFMAVLSKSLKDYFRLKDPNHEYKSITMAIPINLKSKYPKKFEDIALENNFSAVNLDLPLIEDVFTESKKIKVISDRMKKSAEFMVNSWMLKLGVLLAPKNIMTMFNNQLTSKTTLCFSNVPYFRKPLVIGGTNSALKSTTGFFQNNGEIGVAINIMTYCDRVMVGVTTDTARMENPKEFALIFKENLMKH